MKPFLGIDITNKRDNTDLNGQEFVTRKVSAIQADMRDQAAEDLEHHENKSQLPKPLRILSLSCMFVGLVFLTGIIRGLGGENDVTLQQAYQNAPGLFWICGVCLSIWGVLAFFAKRKENSVSESEECKQAVSRADLLNNNSYKELGVPSTADNFDVLLFRYVEKKGQIVPRGFGMATYFACNSKIFTENGNLCLTDVDQRYEFPLSELRRIVTVKKDAAIPSWNKEIPTNKPPYKQYKLRIDGYGFIHFKPFYILELEHHGETWGIYFPSYELPTIEKYTGHHPE